MKGLYVDLFDEHGAPVVTHVFYGETEQECRQAFEDHMDEDEALAGADAESRTTESLEEIADDELPELEEGEEVEESNVEG